MRSVVFGPRFLGLVGLLGLVACQAAPATQTGSAPQSETPAVARPEPEARIPEGPEMKPERVEISETPCRTAIGESASARLLARCIAVSPATRPPCNAANPCDLIQSEIDRSCALFGEDPKPAECVA